MTNMMRTIFVVVALFILLFLVAAPVYAHVRVRGEIWIGPWWGPWWYPYPYYASPPVVIQQAPIVQQPATQQNYWFYCPDSRAYYPNVQDCPSGWMKVVPSPAPGPPQN